MCLKKEVVNLHEILITDGDSGIPESTDKEVIMGLYDMYGEEMYCIYVKKEDIQTVADMMYECSHQ